ncbi:MAG: hypothetical protein ACJ718_04360 [Nitrososphaeraceae archaeon]
MLNKNVIISLGLTIFLMSTIATSVLPVNASTEIPIPEAMKLDWAAPFFGVNLPSGRESPAFVGNVTQLAKMGFDSPENAKLFIQLDSIALNSSSHPGNRTLTTPTINEITSIYNQMKSNNSTGGFTQIASVAMQTLNPRSFFDGAGRNITVVPNSLDFSDTLKFGTLGAESVCGIGPNSRGDFADKMKSGQCVASALGAAAVKLVTIS